MRGPASVLAEQIGPGCKKEEPKKKMKKSGKNRRGAHFPYEGKKSFEGGGHLKVVKASYARGEEELNTRRR